MMSQQELLRIEELIAFGESEQSIAGALGYTLKDWVTAKIGDARVTTLLAKRGGTIKRQSVTQLQENQPAQAPVAPLENGYIPWSGWGTDPNIGAKSALRAFEQSHGMDSKQPDHGFGSPARERHNGARSGKIRST